MGNKGYNNRLFHIQPKSITPVSHKNITERTPERFSTPFTPKSLKPLGHTKGRLLQTITFSYTIKQPETVSPVVPDFKSGVGMPHTSRVLPYAAALAFTLSPLIPSATAYAAGKEPTKMEQLEQNDAKLQKEINGLERRLDRIEKLLKITVENGKREKLLQEKKAVEQKLAEKKGFWARIKCAWSIRTVSALWGDKSCEPAPAVTPKPLEKKAKKHAPKQQAKKPASLEKKAGAPGGATRTVEVAKPSEDLAAEKAKPGEKKAEETAPNGGTAPVAVVKGDETAVAAISEAKDRIKALPADEQKKLDADGKALDELLKKAKGGKLGDADSKSLDEINDRISKAEEAAATKKVVDQLLDKIKALPADESKNYEEQKKALEELQKAAKDRPLTQEERDKLEAIIDKMAEIAGAKIAYPIAAGYYLNKSFWRPGNPNPEEGPRPARYTENNYGLEIHFPLGKWQSASLQAQLNGVALFDRKSNTIHYFVGEDLQKLAEDVRTNIAGGMEFVTTSRLWMFQLAALGEFQNSQLKSAQGEDTIDKDRGNIIVRGAVGLNRYVTLSGHWSKEPDRESGARLGANIPWFYKEAPVQASAGFTQVSYEDPTFRDKVVELEEKGLSFAIDDLKVVALGSHNGKPIIGLGGAAQGKLTWIKFGLNSQDKTELGYGGTLSVADYAFLQALALKGQVEQEIRFEGDPAALVHKGDYKGLAVNGVFKAPLGVDIIVKVSYQKTWSEGDQALNPARDEQKVFVTLEVWRK